MPSPRRTLIVGDGLAGALVAWELYFRGLPFEQWSDGSPAASDVAAGMFNPVSFRRILAQWNAKVQQEEAQKRFRQIERELGVEFGIACPLFGFFRTRPMPHYGKNGRPGGMKYLNSWNH